MQLGTYNSFHWPRNMATFVDIMATAQSLLNGEEPPSRDSYNSSYDGSSTELDDLNKDGRTRFSSSSYGSTTSFRRKSRSDHLSSAFDRDSYVEEEEEEEEEPLFDLSSCIVPSSHRKNNHRNNTYRSHHKATEHSPPSVAPLRTTAPTTKHLMSTTVTSRVVCSLRDTTKFVSLSRVNGNTTRAAAVSRTSWTPRMRTETMQYICLRTIGPLSQHPHVALVLARDHSGKILHLSVYSILGRPVGVEWATGVPTWSNRNPGQHVLQEKDEEGLPSCPAVFEVTQWSQDLHKCMLSHRGCPLIIDSAHRVTLGNQINIHDHNIFDAEHAEGGIDDGTLFFNTPPIDLRIAPNKRVRIPVVPVLKSSKDTEGNIEKVGVPDDVNAQKQGHGNVEGAKAMVHEHEIVADGAVSWYLQGSVEYHFFQVALKSWMERTASNSDETDPDRSWRWPVEYLADVVIDLFPTLSTGDGREAATSAAERVLFREFWPSLITDVRPPHKICSVLSRNLVWARCQEELGGESVAKFAAAGHSLSQLRLMATPSWNVKVVGECFELLASVKDIDEERSADFFLPAMVGAVTLSAVPAEILLLLREVLRSVYPLGRYGYWSTTMYAAVEYILQLNPEFVSDDGELAYDSDNNDEITDII